jgi:hypothetical protein
MHLPTEGATHFYYLHPRKRKEILAKFLNGQKSKGKRQKSKVKSQKGTGIK